MRQPHQEQLRSEGIFSSHISNAGDRRVMRDQEASIMPDENNGRNSMIENDFQ